MKKKKTKIRWKNKIAIIISFDCLIMSIANIWLKNNTIQELIFPLLFISMLLNYLSETEDSIEWMNKYFVKANECIDYCWVLTSLRQKIIHMELPTEEKNELLDYIYEQYTEIHEHKSQKIKELKLNEDDI